VLLGFTVPEVAKVVGVTEPVLEMRFNQLREELQGQTVSGTEIRSGG
jgi:hypothetical protein